MRTPRPEACTQVGGRRRDVQNLGGTDYPRNCRPKAAEKEHCPSCLEHQFSEGRTVRCAKQIAHAALFSCRLEPSVGMGLRQKQAQGDGRSCGSVMLGISSPCCRWRVQREGPLVVSRQKCAGWGESEGEEERTVTRRAKQARSDWRGSFLRPQTNPKPGASDVASGEADPRAPLPHLTTCSNLTIPPYKTPPSGVSA